jgi:hypothetical protein
MRFNDLFGFGLLFLAAAAPAPAQPALAPDAFRVHVEQLADDAMEGRRPGTPGYDRAAQYVAARFAELGLTPAADGSWYQQVPLVRFGLTNAPATLTVSGRSFRHGREVLFAQSPESGRLSIEAPVVFAGYGLDEPILGFDDYAELDVRGKVVAVINGHPGGVPSDVAAHLQSAKQATAARHGAIGMVIVRNRAEMAAVPWRAGRAIAPGLTWADRQGRPHSDAPGLRFVATLDLPAAAALFREAPLSLDRILDEVARPNGRPRGFALDRTVAVQREIAIESFNSPNVIAVLPGSDPALADEYVLLMAHLDGLGIDPSAKGNGGARIRNGAMDNAAGVATMIEVARQLTQGARPRRPILFAALTAEEEGLRGAQYLAQNPVVAGRIIGAVNLDMPILTYQFEDVIAFGAEHSTLGEAAALAAALMNVALSDDPLPDEGLFVRSDHYRFVQAGVPAIFLMTGFAGEGQHHFTDFLANHYHSTSDDLSLPFDWEAGARFARLNYLIAREVADADAPPLWYADSYFGSAFGGGGPRAVRNSPRGSARGEPDQFAILMLGDQPERAVRSDLDVANASPDLDLLDISDSAVGDGDPH